MIYNICAFQEPYPQQWSFAKEKSLKQWKVMAQNAKKQAETKRDGIINPKYNFLLNFIR